jgi:hypothetical protein
MTSITIPIMTASPSRPSEGLTRDDGEIAVMKRGAFDYGALNHLSAKAARDAAERIRKRMKDGIVETGRELLHIKKLLLDHGQFGRWLEAEFGMTDRTARNYMAAAELVEAKSEIVSVLPAAILYKLASPSTPDIARDTIIERVEKGDIPSTKEVADEIAQRRHEKAEADRLARIPPAKLQRMRRSREQRERQREAERLEREQEERDRTEAAQQAVAILRDHLDGEVFKEFAKLFERSSYRFGDELRKELETLS